MILFWIVLLFFLPACQHTYRGHPLQLGCTDLTEQVGRALDSNSFIPGDWDNKCWWEFFHDPELNRLIEASLACHPDMLLADARICLAKQEALKAQSTLFPHFFLVGDVLRQKASKFGTLRDSFGWFTETTFLVQTQYELDIWRKNRSIFYGEIDRYYAEIAEKEQARLLLSTAVAYAYFNLQSHRERLALAEKRIEERKEALALYKQQHDQGVLAALKVYETDIEVKTIQEGINFLKGAIEIDKHALSALVYNVVCQRNFDTECIEPAAFFCEPLPLPATLPLDLLARRPDVVAARLWIEAACFDIRAAKARFLPNLNLMAYIGFQSILLEKLFTYDAMILSGEALGILPLFTGGKLCAELGIARETFEIAIQEYNQIVLKAVEQVSNALTDLITADAQEKASAEKVHDAERLYALNQQRFTQGVSSRLAVLDASDKLLIEEDQFLVIELERLLAALSVFQSIGGGYFDYCSSR